VTLDPIPGGGPGSPFNLCTAQSVPAASMTRQHQPVVAHGKAW
jgi:hypothetical protein